MSKWHRCSCCCFTFDDPDPEPLLRRFPHPTMADLTIRNLTATPLELKVVERFEGQPTSDDVKNDVKKLATNLTSKFTDIFNNSSTEPVAPKVRALGNAKDRRDVSVPLKPFQTQVTDVRAADPGREVLRLTFESEGHRYQAEVPGASDRSIVMKRLDGAPNEYTVVYVQAGGCLSIFSSAHLSRWMREIRDEFPLPALSIPGTHNSPTCHVALPSVRCQAVGVREQLDNGVRFLDIRVSVSQDNDDLALVHSAFPISLTGNKYFKELIETVYAFLEANPSETVITSIKREGTGRGTDQKLSKLLKAKFYDPKRWYTEPRIPKLGEVRGRIILLRRHANDESLNKEWGGRGWGLDGSAWPDNCEDGRVGSGIARVQDFYEIDQSTNIQKKIEFARKHLERAAEPVFLLPGHKNYKKDAPPKPFFINFLSASNFFNANCWPEKIAAKVNPAIIEYLCVRHGRDGKGPAGLKVGDAATGIVVTDWVGLHGDWDLIRCIVGWNAKLQLKQGDKQGEAERKK
ncbi:phosphatidylinositol-specific phospholipase C [Poronia punctata]|nr:phosphatidylinositol-specific phospholipase C [Poronia punctata]